MHAHSPIQGQRKTVFNYAIAFISVLLVMLLKWITDRLFGGGPPLILFLSAVMVTSRFCGFLPGIAATALSALVCCYFYFPPVGTFQIHSANDVFRLGMFLLEAVTLSALMESLHAARRRVEQSTHETILKEQALRRGEERFHHLVQSVEDYFIIMLDPNGFITSWNAGAERIKGYSAQEIIGQHFSRFYPPEEIHGDQLNRLLIAAAHGDSFREEGRRVRRDGSLFWADVVIRAIRNEAGQLEGFSKVTRDVTERRRLDEELRCALELSALARDQAENANRVKGEFMANMSHEIRTPMNGVLGLAELVLGTELTTEQQESMDLIKASGQALMVIINDILDFSKIEAKRLTLDSIEFRLPDLVKGTVRSHAPQAHSKGIEIVCDLHQTVPECVIGDSGRLRQVLINLIGNAIKFTEQGKVVVRSELISQSDGVCQIRIAVSDTGIGIPIEKQGVIFEAFSQADGSFTRKYGGTGLGLTISSQLVALMGGTLCVESTIRQGSTFHFTIPFGLPAAEIAHQNPSPLESESPHDTVRLVRILVAEDNQINRHVVFRMLTKHGFDVTMVNNGKEALDAIDRDFFHVVLMDVQMAELDGFQATQAIRIKEESNGRHLPIIALTAHAMKGDKERCLEAGMDGYVTKPIIVKELLQAIRLAISSKESLIAT
ncbi:MAG: multi-sensor hybrid histidine kinase [Planctomycetaceae bacterium]|nr:multi-sensor hybrid histidine kinase [Planctomycetaceae bacterium]